MLRCLYVVLGVDSLSWRCHQHFLLLKQSLYRVLAARHKKERHCFLLKIISLEIRNFLKHWIFSRVDFFFESFCEHLWKNGKWSDKFFFLDILSFAPWWTHDVCDFAHFSGTTQRRQIERSERKRTLRSGVMLKSVFWVFLFRNSWNSRLCLWFCCPEKLARVALKKKTNKLVVLCIRFALRCKLDVL